MATIYSASLRSLRRICERNKRSPARMPRAVESLHTQNQFLRSLSLEDRVLLAGNLSRITVEPGEILLDEADPIAAVYFPETVIVSIERQFRETERVETAVVGYEGMVGWSALVGSGLSQERAVVQTQPGTVLVIPVVDIMAACEVSRTLQSAVMRFIEIVMTQMSQAIVSLARDSLDLRVCRWLLMRHDRIPTDQIFIKHDEISRNLGSRRASVTDCLHVLEGQLLIRCYRGRIIVRDRASLERHAGQSYGAAEMYYRTMIGPFGAQSISKCMATDLTPGFHPAATRDPPLLSPSLARVATGREAASRSPTA